MSVEYLQEFSKKQISPLRMPIALSSGFDSVFDYSKSCRNSSKSRYSTFADVTGDVLTSRVLCLVMNE